MIRLFVAQFAYYAIICVAYRAVAQAQYLALAIADFMLATLAYLMIRHIATNQSSVTSWLSYALGGVAGSVVGTWVSKTWLGV